MPVLNPTASWGMEWRHESLFLSSSKPLKNGFVWARVSTLRLARRGQKTACSSWFSLNRLGSKCLYPPSHLRGTMQFFGVLWPQRDLSYLRLFLRWCLSCFSQCALPCFLASCHSFNTLQDALWLQQGVWEGHLQGFRVNTTMIWAMEWILRDSTDLRAILNAIKSWYSI